MTDWRDTVKTQQELYDEVSELKSKLASALEERDRYLGAADTWRASCQDEIRLRKEATSRLDALLSAARFTLTEQRREFERGAISDLDRLEDAISACGVEIPVETCTNAKVGTFPSEPHPDVKRWPLGPVQIYPDVERREPFDMLAELKKKMGE